MPPLKSLEAEKRRAGALQFEEQNRKGYSPDRSANIAAFAQDNPRTACEPRPPRAIESSMRDLEMTASQLEQLAESLEGRLHAVLEHIPQNDAKAGGLPPHGPGLAPSIAEQSQRIGRVNDRLQSLLNRLEL